MNPNPTPEEMAKQVVIGLASEFSEHETLEAAIAEAIQSAQSQSQRRIGELEKALNPLAYPDSTIVQAVIGIEDIRVPQGSSEKARQALNPKEKK